MVTPDDSTRWDDPEALEDEYAEDVALEEDDFDPDAYVDPTDRGDGTKRADPNYGQMRHDGADIAARKKPSPWRQWERSLRSPSNARPSRLTGPERDLLSKTDDEIAAEIHEAGQQLRKARTPATIAEASERFVQLLDDLWKVELDPDVQPITDGAVTRRAALWSDSDRFLVRAVRRCLIEHHGWNQPSVRRSRKSHATPTERVWVLQLYVVAQARAELKSDRAIYRMIEALTGIRRGTAQRWVVAHFAEKSPNPLSMRGKPMSAPEMPTLAQEHADLKERVSEIERWVGLPVGGRRAAEQAVEKFIEAASTQNEGTPDA
jgi:hypothetical protein